jgi:hypothetical protein
MRADAVAVGALVVGLAGGRDLAADPGRGILGAVDQAAAVMQAEPAGALRRAVPAVLRSAGADRGLRIAKVQDAVPVTVPAPPPSAAPREDEDEPDPTPPPVPVASGGIVARAVSTPETNPTPEETAVEGAEATPQPSTLPPEAETVTIYETVFQAYQINQTMVIMPVIVPLITLPVTAAGEAIPPGYGASFGTVAPYAGKAPFGDVPPEVTVPSSSGFPGVNLPPGGGVSLGSPFSSTPSSPGSFVGGPVHMEGGLGAGSFSPGRVR